MFYLFLIMLLCVTCTKLYLNYRQKISISKHQNKVPTAFSNKITLEQHQKSAKYNIQKLQSSNISIIVKSVLILLFTYGGILNYYNTFAISMVKLQNQYIISLVIIILFILTEFLVDVIFDYYNTFVIDTKFGFNKTTIKIFVSDRIKILTGIVLIYLPFLLLIIWFLNLNLNYDWLLIWIVYSVFTFFIMLIYPILIAPLFNKFTPLKDETLKLRINSLLDKCNFKTNGVYVMDGSRRSSHANAYFTGIGSGRRIVFFDTLINILTIEETEAILAHELGHFKKNHIKKQIIFASIIALGLLFVLSLVVKSHHFYDIFYIKNYSYHNGIILIMLIIDIILFPFKPIFSYLSRKNEFEADNFAKLYSNKDSLISGLVKLYKDNASTITPDVWYVKFYYSHPPATTRIQNLEKN